MGTCICATVTGRTTAELRTRRDEVSGADMVELRLDGVRDLDVDAALAGRRLPVVATCRPPWQGGAFEGPEDVRVRVLERAWDLGAEFVDVEDGAAEALVARSGGRRIVRSFHDFTGVPADADARLDRLLSSGAEVVKLAFTATRLADVVTARRLAGRAAGRGVVLAMGGAGLPSRLLAARVGSRWTYAGDGVAPGQLPLARLRDEFRLGEVEASTPVYGVLGRPIDHSLSPPMHNAAFAAAGVDAIYVPLAAASFDDFAEFARAFDVQGVSVTAPFKREAFLGLASPDPRDRRLGAVNTLRKAAGGWEGRNTDVEGFLAPLSGRPLRGRRAAVLGAGGASRAVALALAGAGAEVTVHARQPERADEVAALVGGRSGTWPPPAATWDLLVNATPVGTTPRDDEAPIALDGDLTGRLVYDLVYNPAETALLRRAAALGAEGLGGLPMLVAQAAGQFEWWTGRTAPVGRMREAASARLAGVQAREIETRS
ncbi:MAG: type I 3-dehydroquinate dehydratase [Vicinamibacterales bacterium]